MFDLNWNFSESFVALKLMVIGISSGAMHILVGVVAHLVLEDGQPNGPVICAPCVADAHRKGRFSWDGRIFVLAFPNDRNLIFDMSWLFFFRTSL